MKIVSPSFDLLSAHDSTEISMLKRIERCGRICYKSEDKITDSSCIKFTQNIISRRHEAVLEHASFIFLLDVASFHFLHSLVGDLITKGFRSYLRFTADKHPVDNKPRPIVSGNVRAWRDLLAACYLWNEYIPAFLDHPVIAYPTLFPEYRDVRSCYPCDSWSLEYLEPSDLVTENEKLTHCDRTVIFTCDRGISHEIVRHRPASYCQESTRYCNYSKEGFGGEIAVIEPSYLSQGTWGYDRWKLACEDAEKAYFVLLDWGLSPQEARGVLPTCLKTEICMTTNLREWRHFVQLRSSKAAHPQIREQATPLCCDLSIEHPGLFSDLVVTDR